jgi:hypothetical protein
MRRHPHLARLLLIDVAHISIEKSSEHFDNSVWVSLHHVMLRVWHSEELRLASFEECVGLYNPVGTLRAKKVPISERDPDREALNVKKQAWGAKRASGVC